MLPVLEKLLILQDRDRKIMTVQDELAHIEPERQELAAKLAAAQATLEKAKLQSRQIESDRKKLELDVDAKKQLIDKYSVQQFQTKKNEEYKALGHEIEMAKEVIRQLDDQQIELMERAEAELKVVAQATQVATDFKKTVEGRKIVLDGSEANLQKELAVLQSNRSELAAAVEETICNKYDRLLKQKGQNVVVGIQHGVCGGCHMQLSRSVVVQCQGDQEIVTCPNCGRILYYTRDMDLAVAD